MNDVCWVLIGMNISQNLMLSVINHVIEVFFHIISFAKFKFEAKRTDCEVYRYMAKSIVKREND